MPELPEVELVRRQLESCLCLPQTITDVSFSKFDLRTPFPRKQKNHIQNQTVTSIERRGKYLILRFKSGDGVLTHLGMTGHWRIENSAYTPQTHDHVVLSLEGVQSSRAQTLIYNDPRRFGFFELLEGQKTHRLLQNLGPEPFSPQFSAEYLYEKVHARRAPIKNLLMNASLVVGVGNIYASEALFLARISPLKSAHRLRLKDFSVLVLEVQKLLKKAIEKGGSSFDDYRHVSGERGSFQKHFSVYDRASEPCLICATKIRKKVLSGRSTFWCPTCQK